MPMALRSNAGADGRCEGTVATSGGSAVQRGDGKAVSRIRQSRRAGQPNTSGLYECPTAGQSRPSGTVKGKAVWETVSVALP